MINYTAEAKVGVIYILLTNAFFMLSNKIKSVENVYDFPIFLTHTSLVEDPENVGIDAYRYIIFNLDN